MSKAKFKRGDFIYHMDDPSMKCVIVSSRGQDCLIEAVEGYDDNIYLVPKRELELWDKDLTSPESVV